MNIVAAVGIALFALVCIRLLQSLGSSAVVAVSVVSVVVLLLLLLPSVEGIISALRDLALRAGVERGRMGVIFRGLGIALITRFAAGVCLDSGQKALSETVEYFGQVSLAALALPMVLDLVEKLGNLNF